MRKALAALYKSVANKDQYQYFKQLVDFDKRATIEDVQLYQQDKLKHILKLAKDRIPYYRDSISFDPGSFSYADFTRLPLMDKNLLSEKIADLTNENFEPKSEVFKNTSGGSTGRSATFFQTRRQSRIGQANYWLALHWNGVNVNDRSLDLWGAERDMYRGGIRRGFKQFLQNRFTLNTFVLNERIIKNYIRTINQYKPAFIKAYVHSMYEIARYINQNGIRMACRPVIHTSTGPLYDEMRTEIVRAFNNAYVYSFYGSREVSAMASNIPDNAGMRVMYDNVLIEILDYNGFPVKKGEEGEIVVTTLNNDYMPLIRYKIGDRAVKRDNIPFGSLHIGNVLGRTLGVIYRKDGTHIDGQYFVTLFFGIAGIDNFQMIQENLDTIILNVVKGNDFDERLLEPVLKKIKAALPDITKVALNYVTEIKLTETGKIMYVFSKVNKA